MSASPDGLEVEVAEAQRALARQSRSYRMAELGLVVDGVPFDLRRYRHVVQILDDDHPDVVIIKGAQLGLTLLHVLKAIDRAMYGNLRGSLYLFPRDDDVSDFSRARFDRILQDNPALAKLVGNTSSIGVKQVAGSFIYFRAAGAREASTRGSASKLKSIPVDDLYMDELDDMPLDRVELALKRVVESADPHISRLGTPTIPEHGVDLLWNESDRHTFHHRCARCRHWQSLEIEWPDCLAVEGDEAWYACAKCREPLEIDRSDWVAEYPDRPRRGYWINRLNSPTTTPLEIALEWEEATRKGGPKLREFYNSVLGQPYADVDDALDEAMVRAACHGHPRAPGSEGPCALGADIGAKRIHFQIREKLSDAGASRVVQWGHVETFRELGDLMKRYNVSCAVLDGMAETRSVRKFCNEHRGRAFGCWYAPQQRGRYRWDIPNSAVYVNRTESLDESHREIVDLEVEFPRPDKRLEEEVMPQLLNLARVVSIDELTGQRSAKWIVRGAKNDHLRHAHNYARIALGRVGVADRLRRVRRSGSKGKPRGFMTR